MQVLKINLLVVAKWHHLAVQIWYGKRGGECQPPGQEGQPAGYSMQTQLSPEVKADWIKSDTQTFCPDNLSRRPTDPATEFAANKSIPPL